MTPNENLQQLIQELKKSAKEAQIWKALAKDLSRSTRQRRAVNISRINRFTEENETIVVPGKVLGAGEINHKITVAAWAFSKGAKQSIERANGTCMTLTELAQKNPKGKDIKIIG